MNKLKREYKATDNIPELVEKNKENIEDLNNKSGTANILVDDTALLKLQNDTF